MSVSPFNRIIGCIRFVLPLFFLLACILHQSFSQQHFVDGPTGSCVDSSSVCPVDATSLTERPLLFSLSRVASSISVIPAEEIEASSALHVGELLQSYLGASSGEYGFLGQYVAAGFRGAADGHILFLIDGRPANDPFLGGFDLNMISPEMIERIEVIKGCSSSYFGSEAIGATVHIVTKKGIEARPYTNIRYELGDLGLNRISVLFGQRFLKRHFLSVGFEERKTDGFRSNDEYSGKNINSVFGYTVNPTLTVSSKLRHYRGDLELPGTERNPTLDWHREDERTDLDIVLQNKGEKQILSGRIFFSDVRSEGIDSLNFSHQNRIYGAHLERSFRAGCEGNVAVGSQIQRNTLESTRLGKHAPYGGSLYALWELHPVRRMTFLFSGRYDGFSEHGDRFSPGLMCGLDIPRICVAHLSLQSGYRAPTLTDLFQSEGNSHRGLERSRCLELSLSRSGSAYAVRGGLFMNEVRDQRLAKDWGNVQPASRVDSRNRGFEFIAGTDIKKAISLGATFVYLHSEDTDKHTSLPYRPKTAATVWLQFHRSFIRNEIDWRVRLEAEHIGEQYSDYDELSRVKKYGLLRAKVMCTIHDLSLYALFRNLTETSYQSRFGYPMPGRTFRFGGTWGLWD